MNTGEGSRVQVFFFVFWAVQTKKGWRFPTGTKINLTTSWDEDSSFEHDSIHSLLWIPFGGWGF
eukprot:snap_masked-scaffold_26-processed-gene-2.44-mRNA-1 protein AED:1.00 eAED:1.00 QI:0/-1/0/0/-1/1/1/0/63